MNCSLCPRKCDLNGENHSSLSKLNKNINYCGKNNDDSLILLSKVMIHNWEEPCISGKSGSGAIFFGGCNLGCSFCQNFNITNRTNPKGDQVSTNKIQEEMIFLETQGCHNINFVTGTHYLPQLVEVMKNSRCQGMTLPFLWNSSSYETEKQIDLLNDVIDIYLPDLKFISSYLSSEISCAPDYFETASKAIIAMKRHKPVNRFKNIMNEFRININNTLINTTCGCNNITSNNKLNNNQNNQNNQDNQNNQNNQNDKMQKYINNAQKDICNSMSENLLDLKDINNLKYDENNCFVIQEGLILRHLVLPGFYKDSIKILEWIEANLSNETTISLLSQYIPDYYEKGCIQNNRVVNPSLNRKLTTFEYEKVVNKALSLGFKNIYIQKRESAINDFVPTF